MHNLDRVAAVMGERDQRQEKTIVDVLSDFMARQQYLNELHRAYLAGELVEVMP